LRKLRQKAIQNESKGGIEMPEVNIYHPCITRISYRQEKGDSDYGTCLWADFEFDTINYRLQIMSDCGNYSYQWVPTPGKESFFWIVPEI
jgi:hypothetical protein